MELSLDIDEMFGGTDLHVCLPPFVYLTISWGEPMPYMAHHWCVEHIKASTMLPEQISDCRKRWPMYPTAVPQSLQPCGQHDDLCIE
jgi:hypothetical protein